MPNNYHAKPVDELTFTDDGMFQAVMHDDDKTTKVIYNASAYEREENPNLRDFLRYVYTNETGDDVFSNKLSDLVEKLKENEKFRSDYLAMNLHDRDIRMEAIKEGSEQKAIEAAITIIKKYKATPEQAAKDVGAPLEKVLEMQKRITESL